MISESEKHKKQQARYINRELSWLAFNQRVFDEALNTEYPLLERLKFLSISSSNLDEFVMVRIAGLKDQVRNKVERISLDGKTPEAQLEAAQEQVRKLRQQQQQCWCQLKDLLKEAGVVIKHQEELSAKEMTHLRTYFQENIFPALSPMAIDPAHPFPFLPNLGLAIICQFIKSEGKESHLPVVILLPETLPRFVSIHPKKNQFILLEELVLLFKDALFPGLNIEGQGVIRIIRDSELEVEEDAEDLMSHFETAVKRRRRGRVINLEHDQHLADHLRHFMAQQLHISAKDIDAKSHMLGLRHVIELYRLSLPKLKFKPYKERYPERINDFQGDCFAAIKAKDIIIHHPYETFDVVVKFLEQAAADPDVIAIKQTLYRTSQDSPIVKALIRAAEAGKSVTVVVELKARFDEESNIRWARNLERAGAQVVFGFVELKTHAKISLVVRREGVGLVSYAHFGTGNYHSVTARTYSDLSFFTCQRAWCSDAALLFNYLTGYSSPKRYEKLIVSPRFLREGLLTLIDQEIAVVKQGKPGQIWAKMNALIDGEIIEKLYEASGAGVQIDLVIRGICSLRPGVKGLSENIRVKSMVGRYLEHARISCFGGGYGLPSPQAKVFISSADWMTRNLNRRIELMVPIENPTVHEQVMGQIMVANLKDEKQSWLMQSDGSYVRISTDKKAFSAHDYFMTNPSLSGRGKSLSKKQVKKQREKIYRLISPAKPTKKTKIQLVPPKLK